MEFAVQTMTSYATSLQLARWAESEGLAAFAVADHYLRNTPSSYALDQLAVLAGVAAETQTIPLCTLVSPITFRHPAVMWKTAVTIDEISGGRFGLGLGAAWMDEEHERFGFDFPPTGERFDRMTEALAYMSTIRSGHPGGFAGDHYSLKPGEAPEPRGETVRLIIGGSGPRRTPQLAGRYADEFNVYPSRHDMGERIVRAREAAEQADRDPDSLLISTAFPLVAGEDESDVDHRIQQLAESRGADADGIRARWPQAGIPVGTVSDFQQGLQALEEKGVTRVYFQMAFDSLEEIQRLIGLLKR